MYNGEYIVPRYNFLQLDPRIGLLIFSLQFPFCKGKFLSLTLSYENFILPKYEKFILPINVWSNFP